MKHLYCAPYDALEFEKRLHVLIHKKVKMPLKYHVEAWRFKNANLIHGSINQQYFRLWVYEGRHSSFGSFYPVIKGVYKTNNKGLIIKFSYQLNSIAKIFLLIVIITAYYLAINQFILHSTSTIAQLFLKVIISLTLGVMVGIIPIYAFKQKAKQKIEDFAERLGLKKIQ